MNRSTTCGAYGVLLAACALVAGVAFGPARALATEGGPIEFDEELTVKIEGDDQALEGDCAIARGQTFYVSVEVWDPDAVQDPGIVMDEIVWVKWYRRKQNADETWPDWNEVDEDSSPSYVGSGHYESTLEQTITEDGVYQFRAKAEDEGSPYNDPVGVSPTSSEVSIYGVEYVIALPNPEEVKAGNDVELTGKAYNKGPNGERYYDTHGSQISGQSDDDIELNASFEWAVSPALGTLDPTDGVSTTFSAGQEGGTCSVTATHDSNDISGYSQVTVYVVDYVLVSSNPTCVEVDDDVGISATAYSCGRNGERYYDEYGNAIDGQPDDDVVMGGTFNWSVSPTRGTFDPSTGTSTTFTAGGVAGWCTVTATHVTSGVPGSADALVYEDNNGELTDEVVLVTVSPAQTYLCEGQQQQFEGHAWKQTGEELDGATFTWSVLNSAVGTLDPSSGASTTLTAGTSPVCGSVTASHSSSGESGSAIVIVDGVYTTSESLVFYVDFTSSSEDWAIKIDDAEEESGSGDISGVSIDLDELDNGEDYTVLIDFEGTDIDDIEFTITIDENDNDLGLTIDDPDTDESISGF